MDGRPVTIRLVDPPLHEFLPKTQRAGTSDLSDATGVSPDASSSSTVAEQLHEVEPDARAIVAAGCAITYPEILEMQVRAIIEAAVDGQEERQEGCPSARRS